MDILIILPLLYILCTFRISLRGYPDSIGREQTGAIKGFWALMILYQRGRSYLTPDAFGIHDNLFNLFLDLCGQLIVVMFLFYSGYGIMCALRRNTEAYLSTFLSHRFLKAWLMFAMAVGCFLLLDIVLGYRYTISTVLLSFTGWESIGNSNWFMFDILVLYLFTYVSLKIVVRSGLSLKGALTIIFIFTLFLIICLKRADKGSWWVDTVLAYPVGMLYGLYKERFENLVRGRRWIPAFISIFLLFVTGYAANRFGWFDSGLICIRLLRFLTFIGTSSVFALVIVMLTMKVRITSPGLTWLGRNAFAIYILQRLPMIIFAHFGLNNDWIPFFAAVMPTTFLIASLYTRFLSRLNAHLFPVRLDGNGHEERKH